MSQHTAAKLVSLVSAAGQDFEFYPTTEEIIAALVKDLKRASDRPPYRNYSSVLDIGAGNGKVLEAVHARSDIRDLHAIEKSTILCESLRPDILIVGTEFAEQSLLSKHVDVIFSNPPYSVFEAWAEKIIRQSASAVVYLVLPARWKNSLAIRDAIKYRDAECKVVGEFDFEDAEDRRARAKVHLLRIPLRREGHGENDDAFERFFNEQFAHLNAKFEKKPDDSDESTGSKAKFASLVVGPTYLESVVSLYDAECATVQNNFHLVSQLDVSLLKEFGINPPMIMKCLKERLAGLRSLYWNELFDNLTKITDRLTSDSRKGLLETLHRHVHVDFTLSNAYAVLIWVIKNANIYIDSQLLKTYELMVEKCNVQLYKSNTRTWVEDRWRYRDEASPNTHFALDYRIVTHRVGGIRNGGYSFEKGLDERAAFFIGDLLTLARNLGFDCHTMPFALTRSQREAWVSGQVHEFRGLDRRSKKQVVLVEARAFKNGNVHLRMAASLILALNVEHGRLKGWLKSREQAVEELSDPEAGDYFKANALLGSNPMLLLGGPQDEREAA